MKNHPIPTLIACLLAIVAFGTVANVGHCDDSTVTLDNGIVSVTVQPSIGKIIDFHRKGGANVLWNSPDKPFKPLADGQWGDFGGERVWGSEQAEWPFIYGRPWPPDTTLDGAPWTVLKQTADSITFESGESKELHVKATRTVSISKDDVRVTIKTTLTRVSASPFPVQVWNDTMINPATAMYINLAADRPDPDRKYITLIDGSKDAEDVNVYDGIITIKPGHLKEGKIGGLGTAIAAQYPNDLFIERIDFDKDAGYGDGANLESYTSVRNDEIESLSPLVHLLPGTSLSTTVTWSLNSLDQDTKPEVILGLIKQTYVTVVVRTKSP